MSRVLCWFSCGASSAVAVKESIRLYGDKYEVIPVLCDTRPSEHKDNYRFFMDCEKWFGREIVCIRNDKYDTVDDVFEKDKYMSGVNGARCTLQLKKKPRFSFAQPDDYHVFGFTFDEWRRRKEFVTRNPELLLLWPLFVSGIRKRDCFTILRKAGIADPKMYQLGFDNNNCPGCVKSASLWYWDMIRHHFPEVFARRCEQSRELGVKLIKIGGVRVFLDELPHGPFKKKKENLSCGPECGVPTL